MDVCCSDMHYVGLCIAVQLKLCGKPEKNPKKETELLELMSLSMSWHSHFFIIIILFLLYFSLHFYFKKWK